MTAYFQETKPSKESLIPDHLLQCHHNPSFDGFTIIAYRNSYLELKKAL